MTKNVKWGDIIIYKERWDPLVSGAYNGPHCALDAPLIDRLQTELYELEPSL